MKAITRRTLLRNSAPGLVAADAKVAHLSCALVHLGETAYRLGRVLQFDPQTETITNDPEANRLLTKQYRPPWGLPASV